MSAGRIARIITGLLILAMFASYSYKHDKNWIHSDDMIEIAEKALASAQKFDQGLSEISINNGPSASTENKTETKPAEEAPKEASETADAAAATTSGRSDDLPDVDIYSRLFEIGSIDAPFNSAVPETENIEGVLIDKLMDDSLRQLLSDAAKAGIPVSLSEGYIKYEDCEARYKKLINKGFSVDDAADITAPPQINEHVTGLACDLTDYPREYKDSSLGETETFRWLAQNCVKYGFILRYPEGKALLTGQDFAPWHFRYVGKTTAEYITNRGLCLEEFIALYK